MRLASYLAISAAPPDDVRGFLPLLRAVLAGLREERMDPTQPVRVGLLSDNAARACDYCHREIFNTWLGLGLGSDPNPNPNPNPHPNPRPNPNPNPRLTSNPNPNPSTHPNQRVTEARDSAWDAVVAPLAAAAMAPSR